MSIKLPSLLAYTRSITPSVGVFFGVESKQDLFIYKKRLPVQITKVGLAATISNYSKDVEKAMENNGKNLQKTQQALVPDSCNFVAMEFALNVVNNFKSPVNCNDPVYRTTINTYVKNYLATDKIRDVAKLYLQNILTARFMFRNLNNASKMEVTIKSDDKLFTFVSHSNLHNLAQFNAEEQKNITILLDELTSALKGDLKEVGDGFKVPVIVNWRVTTVFETEPNTEIYPSQEFLEDSKEGKVLTTITTSSDKDQAAYHSQKIGNAIRTIDIWYPNYATEEKQYPLPVEPYGIDKASESVARKKESLYSYLEKIDDYSTKLPADEVSHFIIACLIRGGVYSGGKSK